MSDVPQPLSKLDRGVSTGGAHDSEGTLVHAVRQNDVRHAKHLIEFSNQPVTPAAIAAAKSAGNQEMLEFLTSRFDPYGEGQSGDGYSFTREEVEALAEVEPPVPGEADDDFEVMQQKQDELEQQLREAAAMEAESEREQARRKAAATVLACAAAGDVDGLKAALFGDHDFEPSDLVSRQAYDAAQRCGTEGVQQVIHAYYTPYERSEGADLVGAFTAEEAEAADVIGEGEDFADELERDREAMAEAEAEEEDEAAGRAAEAVAEAGVSE